MAKKKTNKSTMIVPVGAGFGAVAAKGAAKSSIKEVVSKRKGTGRKG
jgi:prefoldin subunit 5